MSAGFRAGTSNDGYLQINGTDILTVSSGVLGVKNTGAQSEMRLYCESNNAHYASLKSPPHSDFIGNVTFTLPGTSGSSGQVLQTDGSGNLSWVNQSGGGGGGGVSDKMSEGNTEAEVVDTGSDGHFKVTTEGVERLRIDSSGHFGFNIGTGNGYTTQFNDTASSCTLQLTNATIGSGSGDGSRITQSTSGILYIENQENSDIHFWTNGSERVRITSSGEIVSTNGTLRRNVSTSSFTVTGDTASNTGSNINLYGASHSSLANVFRVRTGATERLRVGPSGQIGLGGANYGTSGQVLTSGGASGAVSWTTISGGGGSYGNSDVDNHLNTGGASSGQILSWNGSDYAWVADQGGSGGGGISDLVDDTTPQLGGNLDLNSNNITGTGNISITGTLTSDGISLGDNDKINAGAGNDLQIYHDGTNSFIDNTTGSLSVRGASGNHIRLQALSGEESIVAAANGSVDLYYDNSKKFETTNTGVTVTGTLAATTFSGSGANLTNLPAANITGTLPAISGANLTNLPSDTPADTDVQVTYDISANGSSAYRFTGPGYSGADDNPDIYLVRGQRYRFINGTGSGHPFRIQSDTSGTAYTDGVSGSQSGTQDFNVQHDAPSRLYYQCTSHSAMVGNIYITGGANWQTTSVNTSTAEEIFTLNKVGIGTNNPNNNLDIAVGSNHEGIRISSSTNVFGKIDFHANRSGADNALGILDFNWNGTQVARIIGGTGTDTTNKDDGALQFHTASAGTATERLRIDSVGSAQFTGADSPSGRNTRISRYGSLLVATTDEIITSARCSIDAGNGNIATIGEVNVGGYNGGSTTTDGVLLGAVGGVYSQLSASVSSSGVLWQGMYGSTFTSRITAAGDATFAGTVTSGTINNATNYSYLDNGVTQINRTDNGNAFYIAKDGTAKITLTADGSATFAVNTSTYQTGINLNTTSNLSTLTVYSNNSSTHRSYVVYDNAQSGAAKYRAAIYANGSAQFAAGAVEISASGAISSNRTTGTNDCWNGKLNGSVTSTINADGSAVFTGSVQATGVNLQNSNTSSWFQTGTNLASTDYVWAAKNSSSNVWHSGLQTDGDLYLGGNLAGTNNIALNGSNGSGWFSGGLGIGGYAAANTIDEYEEGSYTPKIYAGTGTTEPAYNWRYGQYVRIGEVVHVWGALGISGSMPSCTQAYIGNLPYNQLFDANGFFHYVELHGYTWASGYGDSGSSTGLFLQTANGSGNKVLIVNGSSKNHITHAMIGSGQRFTFQFSYAIG